MRSSLAIVAEQQILIESLAKGLEARGYTVEPEGFFDTITVEVGAVQGIVDHRGREPARVRHSCLVAYGVVAVHRRVAPRIDRSGQLGLGIVGHLGLVVDSL